MEKQQATLEQVLTVWQQTLENRVKPAILEDSIYNRNIVFHWVRENRDGAWTPDNAYAGIVAEVERLDWRKGCEPPLLRRKKNTLGNSVEANLSTGQEIEIGVDGKNSERKAKEAIEQAKADIGEAIRPTVYYGGKISHAETDALRAELKSYADSFGDVDPRVIAPLVVAKRDELLAAHERSKSGHGIYRGNGGKL
jgi:hypothetical protein